MSSDSGFAPQWASPPGESIAEVLWDRGWTVRDLAAHLEEPVDLVEELLTGEVPITIGIARRLNTVIGASVAFWMARDLQYREDRERILRSKEEWRRAFPVRELRRMGWLSPAVDSAVDALLTFFDVRSVPAWQHRYSKVLELVRLRTSPSFASNSGAVVAWIRQGEVIGNRVPCDRWNPSALRATLAELRKITLVRRPERFLPKLRNALARCGVAAGVVPAPTGCRASGAALWLSGEKGLVLLSARHLTDDHFWFTLYHECAHLLLHRDTPVFIDDDPGGETTSTGDLEGLEEREREANEFAMDALVTPEVREALRNVPLTYNAVLRLATKGGVAPGVLVGQLQKQGRLGQERLNGLKRRYQWVDGELVSLGRK